MKKEQSILDTKEEAKAEESVASEAPTSSTNVPKATGSRRAKVTAPVAGP